MNQPLAVPPAARNLPLPALDSATDGANMLDAWAKDPHGRNFLAHALVQLARDGWLRTEPGEGFEPCDDGRPAPEPQTAPALAEGPMPDQPACFHPAGYEGECPCKPSCACCPVTGETNPCTKPADLDALRDQYAAAIYERNNPTRRWADAHPDDLLAYGGDADAVLAVRDRRIEELTARIVELEQQVFDADVAEAADRTDWTCEAATRAETAEAAIARVQKLLDTGPIGTCCSHLLHAALTPPKEQS